MLNFLSIFDTEKRVGVKVLSHSSASPLSVSPAGDLTERFLGGDAPDPGDLLTKLAARSVCRLQ
jgi:hypothetical protein